MPATLLLADDSVTIQRVIELTFAHEGVRVVSVSDGRQAIRWIDIERPDIVLVDVGLPQVDGYTVASHVKQSAALKHIPVLLLTGAFEPIDEGRARASGCDGILIKPFEPKQLVNRVKDLLAGNRAATAWPAEHMPLNQPRSARAPEPEPMIITVPAGDLELEVLDDRIDRLDPASAPMPAAAVDLELVADFVRSPEFGREIEPPAPVSRFADIYMAGPFAEPPVASPVEDAPMPMPVAMPDVPDLPNLPVAPPPAPPMPTWAPERPIADPAPERHAAYAEAPAPPVVQAPETPAVATFESEGGQMWTSELTEAEMLVAEPLTPPSAPLWGQTISSMPMSMPMHAEPMPMPTYVAQAPMAPPQPAPQHAPQTQMMPAPVTAQPLSLANAFSALLTAERAQPAALVPQVSEEVVEDVVRKVLTRLTGDMVRGVVTEAAERLVRQEIDRIKSDTE